MTPVPSLQKTMHQSGFLDHGGCRLSYAWEGTGSPVLLIQGVGVQGDAWRPQIDVLAPRHQCLWFDNRGLGRSQPASRHLTVGQLADDAAALMRVQEWESAHIVGHSLGGLIALELALRDRRRVRSLTLLCSFANGGAAGASARMIWIGLRTRVGTRRMRRRAFLEIIAPPSALAGCDRDRLAGELAPLFGHDLADHPPVEMAQLRAMRAHDVTPQLGSLTGLATLVVNAAHDPIAPPALGAAVAAGIPGATHVVLADAAHGAPILSAAEVNALVVERLRAVDQVRAARRV